MEFEFVPQAIKEKSSKFDGFLMIRAISYSEKLRLTEKCQFKVNSEGQIDMSTNGLSSVANMIDMSKDYITEVKISSKDGSKNYKSFDELQFGDDEICGRILTEAAVAVIKGPQVSKNSKTL